MSELVQRLFILLACFSPNLEKHSVLTNALFAAPFLQRIPNTPCSLRYGMTLDAWNSQSVGISWHVS